MLTSVALSDDLTTFVASDSAGRIHHGQINLQTKLGGGLARTVVAHHLPYTSDVTEVWAVNFANV